MRGQAVPVAVLLTALISAVASAQGVRPDTGFARWARAHATTLAAPGAATCEDLEALRPVLARARVVALGELIHDARELHLFRNRLARCLIIRFGFTAVALESGFADAVPLNKALLHPPSSVSTLTRQAISYGWGGIPEVQALTEMLRTSNARKPPISRVRLYGIDLTGADGSGHFSRARRSLDELLSYLAAFDGPGAKRLERALAPLLPQFSEVGYSRLGQGARDSLRSLLDSARHLALRKPEEAAHSRFEAERAWALRCVAAARQTMAYLDLLGTLGPRPAESPDFWHLIQLRDSMMAENLLWALEQEGHKGRILLLAHNAHVFADSGPRTVGPPLEREPTMLGQRLRAALGDDYVVIGTEARALGYYLEEQDAPDSTSLGAALGSVGSGWFALDLRAASDDPTVAAWLDQPHTIRSQWGYQRIRPAMAADLLIYADSLSPTGGELP
jgi:erythromycin esterase